MQQQVIQCGNGEFITITSDQFGIGSDGHAYGRIDEHGAIDLDTGEMWPIFGSWSIEEDDNT